MNKYVVDTLLTPCAGKEHTIPDHMESFHRKGLNFTNGRVSCYSNTPVCCDCKLLTHERV